MGYWQTHVNNFLNKFTTLGRFQLKNFHHTRGAISILLSCILLPPVKHLLLGTEELESY